MQELVSTDWESRCWILRAAASKQGRDYGILIAAKGITGASYDLDRAHYEIAMALGRGLHILVLTRSEIVTLTDTSQLVRLLKEKLCELAVAGTIFL